ncbi:MAG: ketopantoate reductase family protein [Candidatus Omnitrophica bacterium]|nr:ketopantoate reductase family protein [Candidatus Omnitrophota bacterium]
MKIAMIGAGAIGGVVAACLHKAGEDVVLIGRQAQVDSINLEGLRINGVRGRETVKVRALTCLDQPYDLVIFAVKTQDIEEAYVSNSEFLESGLVLTTQNGVQADNILSSHFDRDRQLSSIVMFGATYTNTGEITFNFEGDWIIGRPLMPLDPTTHAIAAVLGRAFKMVLSSDIMGQKYLKLFVNFNNCIPALIGKSMQETFADMDLCRLSIMLLNEGLEIITRSGINLVSLPDFPKERIYGLVKMPLDQAASIINKTLTSLSKEPLYGSILQSIMRRVPSEIDFINGEVVQIAHHLKLSAPLNTQIVDMVHEVERTAKFFSPQEVKELCHVKPTGGML